MYMCVRGNNFTSVSTILLLDFGTMVTVWHFLFFIISKIIVCFLSVSLVGAIIVLSFC